MTGEAARNFMVLQTKQQGDRVNIINDPADHGLPTLEGAAELETSSRAYPPSQNKTPIDIMAHIAGTARTPMFPDKDAPTVVKRIEAG